MNTLLDSSPLADFDRRGVLPVTRRNGAPMVDENLQPLYDAVLRRNPGEAEFHQAVVGVLRSVGPVVAKHPACAAAKLLERICEPERQVIFRVVWTDDRGEVHVDRGFRGAVQQCARPLQGWTSLSPVGQPRDRQVTRLRPGLQERAHRHADRRRQGRLRLRP